MESRRADVLDDYGSAREPMTRPSQCGFLLLLLNVQHYIFWCFGTPSSPAWWDTRTNAVNAATQARWAKLASRGAQPLTRGGASHVARVAAETALCSRRYNHASQCVYMSAAVWCAACRTGSDSRVVRRCARSPARAAAACPVVCVCSCGTYDVASERAISYQLCLTHMHVH
jgi:hypothetical protein